MATFSLHFDFLSNNSFPLWLSISISILWPVTGSYLDGSNERRYWIGKLSTCAKKSFSVLEVEKFADIESKWWKDLKRCCRLRFLLTLCEDRKQSLKNVVFIFRVYIEAQSTKTHAPSSTSPSLVLYREINVISTVTRNWSQKLEQVLVVGSHA